MRDELEPESGWLDHAVAAEFPTLAMRYTVIDGRNRASSPAMKDRMADHSKRFTGVRAMELPQHQIPAAYRAFFRQLGLDPDAQPTPVEAIARERIVRGSFPSRGIITDALVVATIESHVALGVLDAGPLDGPLGIRPVRDPDPPELPRGTLVIADAEAPVAQLFGPPFDRCAVTNDTTSLAIVAVGVPGMSKWVLDDALWRVADMIRSG